MRLWVDDERPAPEGWTHALNAGEALLLLSTGEVEELSLDNDLGLESREGWEIANWIEARVREQSLVPPMSMKCHSGNPAARKRIEATFEAIRRADADWQTAADQSPVADYNPLD